MKWIKCSDRLPEEDEWIIAGSSIYGSVEMGVRIGNVFTNPDSDYDLIKGITHWMPLPQPPKE